MIDPTTPTPTRTGIVSISGSGPEAALAAVLGAAPGFLFLDEPLGAADAERSVALARALTGGVIAEHFPQIFLIAHGQAFDQGGFRYTLRMEGGAVLESTLPGAREAARLWEAEAARARAATRV